MAIEQLKANDSLYYRALSKLTGKDYYKTKTGVVIKTEKGKGKVTYNTQTQEITCDGLQNAIIEGTSKADKIKVENSKNVKVTGGASDDEFTIKYSDTVQIDGGKGNNDTIVTYNSNLKSMKNAKYKERTTETGNTTRIEYYDKRGEISGSKTITKEGDKVTEKEYGSGNQLVKERVKVGDKVISETDYNRDGSALTKKYDEKGHLISKIETKSNGATTTETYDENGKLISRTETEPTGGSNSWIYNSAGNLIGERRVVPGGNETDITHHDDGGRTETVTNPNGTTTTNEYDSNGNVTSSSVTNADGSSSRTEYNSDGSSHTENYDSNGNKISDRTTETDEENGVKTETKTDYDPKTGKVIGAWSCEYEWDFDLEEFSDQPSRKNSWDAITGNVEQIEFTYDAQGNIIKMVIVTYTYNGDIGSNSDGDYTPINPYNNNGGNNTPFNKKPDSEDVSDYQLRERLFQNGDCYSDIEYKFDKNGYLAECVYITLPDNASDTDNDPSNTDYSWGARRIEGEVSNVENNYNYDDYDPSDRIGGSGGSGGGGGGGGSHHGGGSSSESKYDPPIKRYDKLGRLTHSTVYFKGGVKIAYETEITYVGSSDLVASRITYDYEYENTSATYNTYDGEDLVKSKKVQIVGQNHKKTEIIEKYAKIKGKNEVVEKKESVYHYMGLNKEDVELEYTIEEKYEYKHVCQFNQKGEVVSAQNTVRYTSQVIKDASGKTLAEAKISYNDDGRPYDGSVLKYGDLGKDSNHYELGYIEKIEYDANANETGSIRTYYGKYDYKKEKWVSTIPTFSVEHRGNSTIIMDLIDNRKIYSEDKYNVEAQVEVDYTDGNRGYLSKIREITTEGNTTTTSEITYNGVETKKVTKTDDYEETIIYRLDSNKNMVVYDSEYRKTDGSYYCRTMSGLELGGRYTNRDEYYYNYNGTEKLHVHSYWNSSNKMMGYSYEYTPKDIPPSSPGYYWKVVNYDGNMNMEGAFYQFYTSATSRTSIQYDSNWHVKGISVQDFNHSGGSTEQTKTYTLDKTAPEVRYGVDPSKSNLPNHAYSIERTYIDEQGKRVKILTHYDNEGKVIGTTEAASGTDNNVDDDYLKKTFAQKCADDPNYGIKRRETLEILKGLTESLSSQANQRYTSEGRVLYGVNYYKELLDLGVSRADITAAINKQDEFIRKLEDIVNGRSDADFDDVFEQYTGKKYNQAEINNFIKVQKDYKCAQAALCLASEFQNEIQKAETIKDLYNVFEKYYGNQALSKLNSFIKKNQNALIGTDLYCAEFIDKNTISYKDGTTQGLSRTDLIPNYLNIWAKELSNDFSDTLGKKLNMNFAQTEKNYVLAYNSAFGSTSGVQGLINKYCQEQDGFTDKLSDVLTIAGAGFTIVSLALSVACPGVLLIDVFAGMGMGYSLLGTFSDNALDFVDAATSQQGLTDAKRRALINESLVELVAYAASQGISAGQNITYNNLVKHVSKKSANILAALSAAGKDAITSAAADFVMAGNTNYGIDTFLLIVDSLKNIKG